MASLVSELGATIQLAIQQQLFDKILELQRWVLNLQSPQLRPHSGSEGKSAAAIGCAFWSLRVYCSHGSGSLVLQLMKCLSSSVIWFRGTDYAIDETAREVLKSCKIAEVGG
uniref:Uncharacterized protein n=1 Tax=Ascaris lumbricoides TaxID=6252 RepID=A0A9J2Q1A0_ASCLU